MPSHIVAMSAALHNAAADLGDGVGFGVLNPSKETWYFMTSSDLSMFVHECCPRETPQTLNLLQAKNIHTTKWIACLKCLEAG